MNQLTNVLLEVALTITAGLGLAIAIRVATDAWLARGGVDAQGRRDAASIEAWHAAAEANRQMRQRRRGA